MPGPIYTALILVPSLAIYALVALAERRERLQEEVDDAEG